MHIRKEYTAPPLTRAELDPSPVAQLRVWIEDAIAHEIHEPGAMVLATCTATAVPSCRTVLLKHLDERGLVFYTNYRSRKAHEIEANPHVAATFLWMERHRQAIVEGSVERISRAESEEYFAGRPRGSQLGAWASSHQDMPLESRADFEEAFEILKEEMGGKPVPLPAFWGGYRIHPTRFEFWQGQPNRLHDRFAYTRSGDIWDVERLSP
jgi:pyridoxamine 5'-phosphate oxidase